jgi:hypothetical protein
MKQRPEALEVLAAWLQAPQCWLAALAEKK